jgi:D-serine deaminase-like pyridoxal phosphate-dependent protein
MHIDDLDTPCLLLDIDAVDRNIEKMAAFFAGKAANVRPHFKTPKTPEIARRQLAAGAVGITVAKLGEAEVLADAGLGPILMANQVVGRQKVDRLMALLSRGIDITVAVESPFNVEELAAGATRSGQVPQAIVEVDSGMHRCGTATPAESVALARMLVDRGIRYRGLMGYEGHMYRHETEETREPTIKAAMEVVSQHREALAEAGLPAEIVSVGGTASYAVSGSWPGVTEVQAGTYVFMDGQCQQYFPGHFESALTLLTTVIAVKERYAVCDAGMKSLTYDHGMPQSPDGRIVARGLSEEHTHLGGDGFRDLRAGQRIELIPSHGDTTLNLHDVYHVRRGQEVVDTWPILAARKFR